MPYDSNERLEREALESLVASDLSAKMKQWGGQDPAPRGGGFFPRLLLVLLALGVAAWLFWPSPEKKHLPPEEPKLESPATNQAPIAQEQDYPPSQKPNPQKSAPESNRYLALAQEKYRASDFASSLRGESPQDKDLLQPARTALGERRYSDALHDLENLPPEYQTDAAYLRGHALFGLKKYGQAAAVFAQIRESLRYGEAAQWYEVLALLPDFESNRPMLLKKLKPMADDESHTFQREAAQLLREL